MGADENYLAERRKKLAAEAGESEDGLVEILWENRDAARLFLACRTQWLIGAFGGWMGLDYTRVRSTRLELGIKRTRGLLSKIQILEGAALEILNERNGK